MTIFGRAMMYSDTNFLINPPTFVCLGFSQVIIGTVDRFHQCLQTRYGRFISGVTGYLSVILSMPKLC
jgi:hypothetical protein